MNNNIEKIKQQSAEKIKQLNAGLDATSKSRDTDDPLDVRFHEPVGYVFMLFFKKIGFTPNMVTILSAIVGFAGGWLFISGSFWIRLMGVLLSILAIILDCTDGQLARATGKTSELGRLLDGGATIAAYAAQYIAVGIKMMHEPVFYTNLIWGGWCWLMIIPCAVLLHANQCRMADYFRNLHLFFLLGSEESELDSSEELQRRYEVEKAKGFSFKVFYMFIYIRYTRMQEMLTPNLQRFFAVAGRDTAAYSDEMRADFVTRSRKYIQLTNVLTINLRAYILFVLVLIGQHEWFFPALLIMEIINAFMIYQYEKIIKNMLTTYFPGGNEE